MTPVMNRVKADVRAAEARMRGTRAQAAENRDRIDRRGGAAFRERGFDGIGVAEIMRSVGLTHGGFYGHFASKEELMALACRRAVADMLADWRARAAAAPGDPAASDRRALPPGRASRRAGRRLPDGGARPRGRPRGAAGAAGGDRVPRRRARHASPARCRARRRRTPARDAIRLFASLVGAWWSPAPSTIPALSDEVARRRVRAAGLRPTSLTADALTPRPQRQGSARGPVREGAGMVARAYTVAFQGVEARLVEVQCAIAAGLPAFNLVGLPDKAVSEAKERVRAAMTSMGLALPAKRITVNLSPADLPKEGSHFDLPIALALLAAMDVLPARRGRRAGRARRALARRLADPGDRRAAGGARRRRGRLRADLPGGLRRRGRLGRRGRR